MATLDRKNTLLGDVVAAAFDEASVLSTDPREVSRLAAQAVTRALSREWATVRSMKQRTGSARIDEAWARLLLQCAGRPLAVLERAAGALGRGVVGGRGTW